MKTLLDCRLRVQGQHMQPLRNLILLLTTEHTYTYQLGTPEPRVSLPLLGVVVKPSWLWVGHQHRQQR
jgi:hypothetical protein